MQRLFKSLYLQTVFRCNRVPVPILMKFQTIVEIVNCFLRYTFIVPTCSFNKLN